MITLRTAEDDAGLETWAAIKSAVAPDEPVTGEELRRTATRGRLLLLADVGASAVGCGLASPSSFPDATFVAPRVLPAARGQGVGCALLEALADHAAALGRPTLVAHVDGGDVRSLRFARRFGFVEFDRQVEQRRSLGAELEPTVPAGLEIVAISERPKLLERAWREVAVEAYADLPLADPIAVPLEEWLEEEATLPGGSFVALAGEEVVGYAGLLRLDAAAGVAEHGLTAVRRDHRGRGIATALKRRQLAWAASNGLRELVTWTQRRNEDMQRLNRRLGYTVTRESVILRAGRGR